MFQTPVDIRYQVKPKPDDNKKYSRFSKEKLVQACKVAIDLEEAINLWSGTDACHP